MPAHELKLLSLIDVFVESSFLVLAHDMGTPVWVHTWGILILGNPAGTILVDTGARDAEIMGRLHMQGRIDEDMQLENALAAHGVAIADVAAVLHTHCHIDHAGQDDRFPMTTPVVMNRRELEHSVSGLMGAQYPPEYVKHHIDRLHTPGALRLLDLAESGPDEIFSGIVCESAGGHTEGSMNVLVETAEGTACISGDVIYDIQNQVVEPWHQVLAYEPQTTGNHSLTKRSEKAAIKRALNHEFVLPLHDFPARVEGGRVVARLKHEVPGPEWSVEEFAAEFAEPVTVV
jgi:glyoxylase-like metal-dependent hydrolase (beta-lactamase superfamily II)